MPPPIPMAAYSSDWACTPLTFIRDLFSALLYSCFFTADMTLEEPKQTHEIPTKSKYTDDFKSFKNKVQISPQ